MPVSLTNASVSSDAFETWRIRAAALAPPQLPFIDGRFVESGDDTRFETINPATGAAICALPVGCATDVDNAVAAARRAFEDGRWHRIGLSQRKTVLLRIADLIEQNGDELALLDTLEMGKAIGSARAEIAFASGTFRFYAEAIDKLYGSVAPADPGIMAFSLYEPRGVVGAIVPWNFPLINAVVKAAPALAAGNSIVLKPSELASLSAMRLSEIAVEAGVPDGVFNVLPGLGSTVGEAIGRHADIDFLSFTGSTATGRRIMQMSGESNGKPLMLECGGKSPQIVCAEMDDEIEPLAARIVHDAFWNIGQWCAARSRLIVEDRLHDTLLGAVVEAASKLVPGDPLDPETRFGTIASAGQFARIRSYVERAQEEGAQLVTGDGRDGPCTLSMAPVIFSEVEAKTALAQEEIFGPVLCVMRFSNMDEAIIKANDTPYGLGATIWTRNARSGHMAARGIRAGKVNIRASACSAGSAGFALGAEPWGASGFGIERGLDGLRSYYRTKAVEMSF